MKSTVWGFRSKPLYVRPKSLNLRSKLTDGHTKVFMHITIADSHNISTEVLTVSQQLSLNLVVALFTTPNNRHNDNTTTVIYCKSVPPVCYLPL